MSYQKIPMTDNYSIDHNDLAKFTSPLSPTSRDPLTIKDRRRTSGAVSPSPLTIHTSGVSSSLNLPKSGSAKSATVPTGTASISPLDHQAQACTRFIKLIGIPKPSAAIDETDLPALLSVDASGQPIKPTAAEVQADALSEIELSKKIVDVLDAENEDPFTLEPLENLMRLHTEGGRDFILARVATVDPLNETRFYYSYYAAHHINKVLFRTQPELNLLHRMKAKNPLNNMTIVGDVHYYVFTAEQGRELNILGNRSTGRLSGESNRISREFARVQKPHLDLINPATIVENIRQFLIGSRQDKKRLHLFMSPETVYVSDNTGKASGDILLDTSTFKRSVRRLSADDIYSNISTSIPSLSKNNMKPLRDARLLPPQQVFPLRRLSRTGTNYNAAPWSAGPLQNASMPPVYKHYAVHSMSYTNTREGTEDPYEWIQHRLALTDADEPGGSQYRDGHSGEQHPGRIRPLSGTSRAIEEALSPVRSKGTAPADEKSLHPPKPVFYEFHYYASDDDFLLKSSVRQYFKQHALESGDGVLFTISSSVSTTASPPDAASDAEAHPALLGFHYLIEDSSTGMNGVRYLIGSRYIKYLLVLYIIAGCLIVRLAVPENYAYLAIFLLVFGLCFILIFCVEMRDSSARPTRGEEEMTN